MGAEMFVLNSLLRKLKDALENSKNKLARF